MAQVRATSLVNVRQFILAILLRKWGSVNRVALGYSTQNNMPFERSTKCRNALFVRRIVNSLEVYPRTRRRSVTNLNNHSSNGGLPVSHRGGSDDKIAVRDGRRCGQWRGTRE